VFDVFFKTTNDFATDRQLAEAMRQNRNVVLMAEVANAARSQLDGAKVAPPLEIFRAAAAGWGVGKADPETGGLARRHWPFYAPGEGDIHSLGWTAAQVFGARLDAGVEKQWLRYYGKNGPGEKLPYYQALTNAPGYFRGKIVLVGNWPEKPDDPAAKEIDNDKFQTPYTGQTGKAVGGVEIMATTFLNLTNGDWLRRPPAWCEFGLLALSGLLLGGGLCRFTPLLSLAVAGGVFFAVTIVFASWSYFSNFWFPWLIIAGGQMPVALLWAWTSRTQQVEFYFERFPGYETIGEPFGEGSFGKVWLVRNDIGELLALKQVERHNRNFANAGPYDQEFRGIKNYKPISHKHPGLLRIEYIKRNDREGYFFYVMELGDALDPSWEQKGQAYAARDLTRACAQAGGRLPVRECLRIGIALLDALEFLHQRPLVHRDIKPSNIIFVNGRPKLADVGLIRDPGPEATNVGTIGYMPPMPEPLGTRAADIYAMGKVLYVISTGEGPETFPQLSTVVAEDREFMRLNEIICRACRPAADQRYASAAEMLAALRAVQHELDAGQTKRI
jgi:hypothetical protein